MVGEPDRVHIVGDMYADAHSAIVLLQREQHALHSDVSAARFARQNRNTKGRSENEWH